MKTVLLAAALVAAVLCMSTMSAEAHYDGYFDGVIDVFDYDVTEYSTFDLVRMTVQIENLQRGASIDWLRLATDDGSVFSHATYGDVRGRGAEVSVDDCTSNERDPHIPANGVANMTACFMVNSGFGDDPSGLMVDFDYHSHCTDCGSRLFEEKWWHEAKQIVPFHEESAYCFVDNPGYCNANNIQNVDDTPEPLPPEPEPEHTPEPATLLYTIYHNQTGILTLVLNQLVVASNPDRILLIHDIDAFLDDNDAAPNLDDAELNTADGKRQSAILAFTLSDAMRLQVIQSLRDHGDLVLMIETRAVYAAEGFIPVEPILVPDITVVR